MNGFLTQGGGYRNLRVYQLSEIIYDLTVIFSEKWVATGSRTRDQMVQAARRGKQNIAEGSAASTTSRETEIKLTNVAKASLEEFCLTTRIISGKTLCLNGTRSILAHIGCGLISKATTL